MPAAGTATFNQQLQAMSALAISMVNGCTRYYEKPSIAVLEPTAALDGVKEQVLRPLGFNTEAFDRFVAKHGLDHIVLSCIIGQCNPYFNSRIHRWIEDGKSFQEKDVDPKDLLIATGFNVVNPEVAMKWFLSCTSQSPEPVTEKKLEWPFGNAMPRHTFEIDGMDAKVVINSRGYKSYMQRILINTGARGLHVNLETLDSYVVYGMIAVFEARLKSEEPVFARREVQGFGYEMDRVGLDSALNFLKGLQAHVGFNISYEKLQQPAWIESRGGLL